MIKKFEKAKIIKNGNVNLEKVELNPKDTIKIPAKRPLPDPYAGLLNTKRIRAYTVLGDEYRIPLNVVGEIFNKGISWYKEQLEKEK